VIIVVIVVILAIKIGSNLLEHFTSPYSKYHIDTIDPELQRSPATRGNWER